MHPAPTITTNSSVLRRALLAAIVVLPLALVGWLVRSEPTPHPLTSPNAQRETVRAELEHRHPIGPESSFQWKLQENTIWDVSVRTETKLTDDEESALIEHSTARFHIGAQGVDGWLVALRTPERTVGLFWWDEDGTLRRDGGSKDARPWIFQYTGIWIPDTRASSLRENTLLPSPPPFQSKATAQAFFNLGLDHRSQQLESLGGSFWQGAEAGVDVVHWFLNAVSGDGWIGDLQQTCRGHVSLPKGWIGNGTLTWSDSITLTDGSRTTATSNPYCQVSWSVKRVGVATFDTSHSNAAAEPIPPLQPSR